MALQGSLTLDNGIFLSSAYLIITSICSNFLNGDHYVTVNLSIYKDSSAYSAGYPEVTVITHKCISDFDTYFAESVLNQAGNTTLTQAYVWLITLPSYSGMSVVS